MTLQDPSFDEATRQLPSPWDAEWRNAAHIPKCFASMESVEGQVTNGGFHAVLYNGCAHLLPLALDGYRAIGALAQASLLDRVMDCIQTDPWCGPPETWPEPEAESPPQGSRDLSEFDDEWFALDLGALYELKVQYFRRNVEAFQAQR